MYPLKHFCALKQFVGTIFTAAVKKNL